VGRRSPDGCALDAEGAIWFANAAGKEVVRVREGGEILEVIETPDGSYACALGGADGRTLFVATSPALPMDGQQPGGGRIWATTVDVPHGGGRP
jgi:sugar lactone lactonase YvrE